MIDELRLARADGVGPVTYRRLLARFGSASAALAALPDLARRSGRAAPPAIPSRAEAERECEAVRRLGGRLLVLDGPDYPPLLALLDDAPPVLALLGDPAALLPPAIAFVGGRNASANGQRVAELLAEEAAGAGYAVVSGLARGVDGAAHRGALRTGVTVAAIAGGLDKPYPPEHAALQARIAAEGGAVLAEMPLGTTPLARHFPRRNRVIAGLSLGVVVAEAAPRSGSLITARLAIEAGRELFAIPGSPLDPRCRGSNDLIRQGAHLTETLEDILANLPDHPAREGIARSPLFRRPCPPQMAAAPPVATPPDRPGNGGGTRDTVEGLLGPSPTPVDDLIRRCQLSPAAVMAALLELEVAGRVETLSGHRVALTEQPRP